MKKVMARFPKNRSINTQTLGLLCTVIFGILAVSQLLAYEKLANILMVFWPAGLGNSSLILAALIVITEVFAMPFLLGMKLSPLMRIVSAKCTALVLLYWSAAAVYSVVAKTDQINTGFFGGYVSLPGGWWLVLFMVGIIALVLWYGWYHILDSRKKPRPLSHTRS